MQNTQNNNANQSQNFSLEALIAEVKQLSKQKNLHFMFALEVLSSNGVPNYFALNDKNIWMLYHLGLKYREVIICSEMPICDENGRHFRTYKIILNLAQSHYGYESESSLCERLYYATYVRQFYIDDIFLNICIRR